jgi:exopolysaccharide biosynthesis polyprenyl glycosylphosphotransferase
MFKAITPYRIRVPKWIVSWMILSLDTVAGYVAFFIVILPVIAKTFNTESQVGAFLLIQFIWSFIFWLNGAYKGEFTVSRISEIETLVKTTFTIMVMIVFVDAMKFIDFPLNARGVIRYWGIFMMGSITGRLIIHTFQKRLLKNGVGREKTLIIGYNRRGLVAAESLNKHDQQGYDLVGFVKIKEDPDDLPEVKIPILGTEEDLKSIIIDNQISDVVLALENPEHARIMGIMGQINGYPITIKIVPDMYDVISGLARTQQIAGLPLIQINLELTTWYQRGIKRLLDMIITIPLLIIMAPFMVLIGIAIKLETPGPVFYRQERVGKDFRHFRICKFRSMTNDAEQKTGPVWADQNDPRITGVGRVLRRFRMDEIPQFINVVKGEMSLIGPRPERPYFVDKLTHEFPFYHRRLSVRPGISGWSQIKNPYDRHIEDVRQKLKYDFFYIENLNFSLDLKIVLSTIWVMISGQGR